MDHLVWNIHHGLRLNRMTNDTLNFIEPTAQDSLPILFSTSLKPLADGWVPLLLVLSLDRDSRSHCDNHQVGA
jgi:hypothetical protein